MRFSLAPRPLARLPAAPDAPPTGAADAAVARRQVQLAGMGQRALGQHAGGPLQDHGILNAVAAAPLVDLVEACLPLALEALTGVHDGAGADVEGAHQIGQRSQLVEGAVCEAAVAGAEVVDGMGGEAEGEMAVDGDGVVRSLARNGVRFFGRSAVRTNGTTSIRDA